MPFARRAGPSLINNGEAPVVSSPEQHGSERTPALRLRWVAIGVFVLSSSLNYLDRGLLAAIAPTLSQEFHLTNLQYGQVVSAFSIVYALMAPVAGWFIDRVGLTAGISISMVVWSLAGAATGLTSTFRGLLGCRTMLGIAEAAGIPATGKANATYLEPGELALGTAFNQVGISIGSIAAPLVVAALAPLYGWRSVFPVCGVLGFIWIPLWWFTSRRVPARPAARKAPPPIPIRDLLADRRLWGLVLATAFTMMLYTLWTNWTTLYFVHERQLTALEANRQFAWIPPIFATLGGFFGGWLAFHWIRQGAGVLAARMRVCWISAVLLLATAAIPLMPTPALAAAAISASFFWTLCISTNVYAIPIDLFGPARAGFGVAALTCSFGLMQTFVSPLIGGMVDRLGFTSVCVLMSAMPLAGVWVLQVSVASTPSTAGPGPSGL